MQTQIQTQTQIHTHRDRQTDDIPRLLKSNTRLVGEVVIGGLSTTMTTSPTRHTDTDIDTDTQRERERDTKTTEVKHASSR